MQLVGATDWAIRGPFLFEGVIYGFVGGLLAFSVVSLGYALMFNTFHSLWLFRPLMVGSGQMAYNLLILMVVLGLIIGVAGSLISVDRYLEASYGMPGAAQEGEN
jgi:cell division transport system permease protein